jgi:hypothetical protein
MIKGKFNLKKIAGLFFSLQIIFALALLSLPTSSVLAASTTLPSLQFTPEVSISNSSFNQNASTTVDGSLLARYIITYYNYGLAIVGILATIVLMGAGIIWLTSGGDAGKVSQAKELISGSIVGMAILVCAWIILNTINPNLTQLASITPTVISKVDVTYLTCCDPTTGETKFPIKIVNGKNMAADGSNTIISCKSPAAECTNGDSCVSSGPASWSCGNPSKECGVPGSICAGSCASTPGYYYQSNNSGKACPTNQECCTPYRKINETCGAANMNAKCLTGNLTCPSGYATESSGLDGNKCDTGLTCCRANGNLKNQTCGSVSGAICIENSTLLSCGIGWTHDFSSGNSCGSGLYCCYPN